MYRSWQSCCCRDNDSQKGQPASILHREYQTVPLPPSVALTFLLLDVAPQSLYHGRMRLSERERKEILATVRLFDENARVFLFGSRADDSKKGGDVDLLVLSETISPLERARIRRVICDRIGDQKIDLLIAANLTDPFVKMARSSGILLQ